MKHGEPFELGDGALGIALLHGFTSTPYEVRFLGEQLAREGHHVRAPLLPGHGTSLDDLDRTGWQDWTRAVDDHVDVLARRCDRVVIVGQSLGGLLGLEAASRRPEIAAVASLAAPLWFDGLSGVVSRWVTARSRFGLRRRIRALPKLGGSDVLDPRVKAENPSYRAIPVRALGQLLAFMRIAHEALPRVTQPVLVMHATHDHTAPVRCAHRIATATRAVRTRILPRSYHLISVDVERDIVAAEVATFLRHHAATSSERPSCAT